MSVLIGKKKLLAVGISTLTLFIVGIYAGDRVSRGLFFIIHPMLVYGSDGKEALQSFTDYFQRYQNLLTSEKTLREENIRLKERVVFSQGIQQENDNLKKIAALVSANTIHVTQVAKVIGTFFDPGGLTLFLQGSSDARVEKNSPVIAGERVFIGQVADSSGSVIRVKALRNIGTTFGVTVILKNPSGDSSLAQKRIEGLFVGEGTTIRVDLVSNDVPVSPGDLVVSNGFDGGVRDLLVGEVVRAQKSETRNFQDIMVREIIPFSSLRDVFIVSEK